MYGRAPKFIEEVALNADLLKRFQDGEDQILRVPKYIKLFAPRTTPVTGQITAFTPHDIPYPCVIKPIQQLTATAGTAQSGKLFAFLGKAPDVGTDIGILGIESRGGLLRLPIPGIWWIGYDGPLDTVVKALMYDDTCGAAQHLLSKQNHITRDIDINVAAANTLILGDDQYRDGAILQNQGNFDVWIRLGGAAAAVGATYKLVPEETLPLIGDMAYKGPVQGFGDGGASAVRGWELLS